MWGAGPQGSRRERAGMHLGAHSAGERAGLGVSLGWGGIPDAQPSNSAEQRGGGEARRHLLT